MKADKRGDEMNKQILFRLLILCAACLASGCAANSVSITAAGDVPAPIAAKLPLKVGVYYDEKFTNYTYTEDTEDRPHWSIACGATQTAMFDKVLASMFAEVRKVSGVSASPENASLDLLIAPSVEQMQFSTPTEMKTDFYEAWARYSLAVFTPDGAPVTTWSLEGYGRSTTALLKNLDKGMNEAINVALRDAGAKMVVKFPEIPEMQDRLKSR